MPPARRDAGQHDYVDSNVPMWAPPQEHLWGIVLAGGEGRWLQPFIRACFGCDRPKQLCAVLDGRSVLRHTLLHAERLIPRSGC
jgi:hypothetical protein